MKESPGHEDPTLASMVGRAAGMSVVVVERGPVGAFAGAVFDDGAVYRDQRAAAAAGFDSVPAPPTYPIALAHWGSFEELQPEGERLRPPSAVLAPFAERGGLLLHGEQEFEYQRPIVVGDVLVGEARIVDAYRKESKGRMMTFVVVETTWRDQATGELVARARSNLIHRA